MKSHIYDSKNRSMCIGQAVYLNPTTAFSLLSVHSGYILLVKVTTEFKLSLSPS